MERLVEPSRVATALGGGLWLAHAAVRLRGPTYWAAESVLDYASVVTFSLAAFGLCPALIHVRAALRERSTRLNAWAFYLSVIAAVVMGVGNFLEDGLGVRFVGLVFYLPASLLLP